MDQILDDEQKLGIRLDVFQRHLKLLVVCSTLNLDYPYGATPAIWQLLKAFSEVGL